MRSNENKIKENLVINQNLLKSKEIIGGFTRRTNEKILIIKHNI